MMCIYMISSIIKPERQYIGSACNFKGRKAVHINGLENLTHHSIKMQRHVLKYGIDDLKFEILEVVKHRSLLITAEQSFISMFFPYFNTCMIAGSRLGVKDGPHTQEHKDKISKANKGKKRPIEYIETRYVKMHKYSINGELLHTYKSSIDAMQKEGIRIKSFSKSNITIKGFVWVTENQSLPNFDEIRLRLKDCRMILCKQVQQFDKKGKLIAEYDGVRIACKETGIDHRSISQVASGSKIRKSAGGFIWKYKEEMKNVA